MNPRRLRLPVAFGLVMLAACGSSGGSLTTDPPEEPPVSVTETDAVVVADTSFGQLPVPRTGDDALELLGGMPAALESWKAEEHGSGQAVYQHPAGRLGIEAGELADIYARPVTAAEGVRLFRRDLDEGTAQSCASAPTRCVTGTLGGDIALVWGHDASEVLLVALWPNEDAGKRLLGAWVNARNH